MVHYQVLLSFDTYDTYAIAINQLCKLNFKYFTIYLVITMQQGQDFLQIRLRYYSLLTFFQL